MSKIILSTPETKPLPETLQELAFDLNKILQSFAGEPYPKELACVLKLTLQNYFYKFVYYNHLKREDLDLIDCEFDFYSRTMNISGGKELTKKINNEWCNQR